MRHCKTCMYINFCKHGLIDQSVITVHTNIFAKKCELHKFAATNSNYEKNRLFATCIIVKRTCISIFSKLGLVENSKQCTLIYLQKMPSCINLQLSIVVLKKIDYLRHVSS